MNKQQFLNKLKKELYGLSSEDIQKSLDFYSEMIDDRIDEGLSEKDVVSQIGSPQEIAKQILINMPIKQILKARSKLDYKLRVWEIVLLVLGSPVWLSLVLAIVAVGLSVYIVLWSVIISLYAISFSMAASGIAGVLAFAVFTATGSVVQGAFVAGCGLVCAGVSIFMFMVSGLVTKGLLWLSRKIWVGIKSCFIKRSDYNENY